MTPPTESSSILSSSPISRNSHYTTRKPCIEEIEDEDSTKAHDELTDGSEIPNPMLLSEGKGTPSGCGSGRSEGEAAACNLRGPHNTKVPAARLPPWSAIWCAQRLRDQPYEQVMDLLRMLAHPKRHLETTPEVLREINALSLKEASEAIDELSGSKRFIRGSGNSWTLPATLATLDDRRSFSVKALVDSGCTGSSIDAGFVAAKGINTQKLAHPIPVYNADGTLNAGGVITDYVALQMTIGDHVERLRSEVS